jgi:hypothetical protein
MVKKHVTYFLKIPPFMCDWENNFNHFLNLRKILEGFYSDDQKQSAYKGRGGGNDYHCHSFQADSWESLLKRFLSTNDDSLGTERMDSAWDEADASFAQHGTGSNNKDGGTGTCTTPSADPEVDAMESSVVGEKGDDHAEKIMKTKIISMGVVNEK